MNIDEFIEHAKEKAREHRYHADFFESDNPMNKACIKSAEDCEWLADCLTKFKEYQQLEEQGRLISLPCKVGDTVYVKMASYCKTHYAEAEVKDFVHFISCGFCIVVTSKYFDKQNIPFSEFGKTVFLTKSEAEAKLKELSGGVNDD